MLPKQNISEFEKCNIVQWHKLGYKGQGIKIAEFESAKICSFFEGKLQDPFGIATKKSNVHGTKVLDIDHQIAPEAILYMLPSGMYIENNIIKGNLIEKTIPFLIKEEIHLAGASVGGSSDIRLHDLIRNISDKYGITFTTSAGNTGSYLTGYAKGDAFISVGAIGFKSDNELYLKDYSSYGEELDFMAFSGLYIHDSRNGYEDRVFKEEGTSFSHPMFRGICALVQGLFLEKTGNVLSPKMLYQFMVDCCMDIGYIGHDKYYGHGLPILPHPDSIDIKKYIGGDSMIELKIDSKYYTVDGEVKEMDVAPFIKDDRTFVPIRFIAEALGKKIEWYEQERKVIIR